MATTAQDFFANLTPVSTAPAASTSDPFASLTPVGVSAPAATPETLAPTTGADPFVNLTSVRPSGVYTLDEFSTADEAALTEDKDFSPVEFSVQNKDALLRNPGALEKAIRLYEAKDKRGTTLGEKAAAVVTGVPKVAGALIGGAKAVLKKAYELNPVALAARAAGGDTGETRKVAAEFAEIPAALESGSLGTSDLARRAVRGTKEAVTSALTPDEYRARFFDDIGFAEQVAKAGKGQGAIAEALGTDAASLGAVGINVDPQAVQELSVLADPVNFIPVAGTVGFFSKTAAKGGKLGFRVLATASPAQAARLAGALNKAGQAASIVKEVGGSLVGNVLEGTGKAVSKVGDVSQAILSPLAGSATLGGVITGGLSGAATAIGAAKIAPKLVQLTGESLESLGQVVKGTKALGPKAGAVAKVASEAAKGAAEAGAISLPLFIGARPEEQEVLLGGIGLAAGLRGGASAGKIAGLRAQDRLAEAIFRDVERAPTPDSPYYGTDGALDAAHAQSFLSLPKNEQTVLNHFRELLRSSGVELYSLDQQTFESRVPKVAGASAAKGFFTEAGESVSPTGERTPVARILLNKDVEGLGHELFHAVESIDPEGAKALIDSVEQSWTPEEKEGFTKYYNSLLNAGKPENLWTQKIKGDGIIREVAAEVFGRALNGFDLTGVSPTVKQTVALFLSSALEKLGVPLASKTRESGAGVSTLGIRPSTAEVRGAQGLLSRLADRLDESGAIIPTESTRKAPAFSNLESKDVDAAAGIQAKTANIPVTKPNVSFPRPDEIKAAPSPAVPSVISPEVVPVTPRTQAAPTIPVEVPTTPPARNIRTTPAKQNDFAAKRAEVTNTERASAANLAPEVRAKVEAINSALDSSRTALEIVHSGVATESGAGAPAGRTARRAEQEAAYIQEGLSATPQAFRDSHQKVFVPVRWEITSKGPQLLAMSLDKVIANSARVAKDAAAKGAETLLPYAVENGKIADAAWPELVQDLKSYSANQANGFRGDGQRLVRPTEDIGVSIPVENPDYTPVQLPEAKMNFLNLIQALAPPLTAREVKAGVPGNVKGQIIAEINLRKPETPADIRPQDIQKQTFKSGRTVKETNPLRNELQRAGVDTRELIEVTERINSQDIQSVTPRPDLDISAPVTDIIRGGFLPGKPISEFGKEILDLSTEDWKKATESWDGGLTAEAYRIGLAATDRDYVAKLASLRDQALTIFREKMAEGDLDAAYPFATKSQLFSEAYGAATGTGSARTGFKLRGFDEGSIPFPDYEKGAASESFLPGTEMPDGVDPIETAAIRTEGGKIFTGSWHVDAMMKFVDAVSQGLLDEKLPPGVKTLSELLEGNLPDGFIEDGFVTKSGKFLNRAQALDHAEKIGQLKEGVDSMQHRELGGILESREFEQARAFLPGRDQTGLPFKEFFSSVTKGKFGKSNVSFQSLLDLSGQDSFVSELSKHSGDFDEHISKSIPGYKDTQIRKGAALVEAFPEGAKILDIGASEGSLMKTVSSLSDGKIETVSLDPNPDMAEFFRTKSQVPGAVFEEKAFLKGFEDAGKTVEAYAPEDRFDAINESMVFQFISPEREAQIAEAKRLLKPEGVLMLEEKVKNPGWQANEAKKDSEYKNRYFSTDELKEKDRRIGFQQAKQETKAVGMVDNMVEQSALEGLLSENFKHVVQYWDSGNFKGYAASDSLPTLNKVVAGLGDVKTKFSTVETPREVTTFSAEMDPNYRGLAFGKFLPGDVKPKRNMSKADQDEVDRLLAKYEYTPSVKPSAKLTGWILPNQKFTPLETNFHERDLAQNRAKLNKQFGTKFSEVEDVAQRQDAINAGFVRVRFEPNRGEYNVELNSKFFPKQKSALLNQLVENAESIDNLRVSLLTDKGGVADSISLPLDEMEGPEKTAAIEEAINGLRAKGGSFLPSNLKTARKDFGFEDLVGRQEAKQIPWSHFGKSLDPSLMTQGDETLVTPKLLLASGYKTVDLTDNRSFHDLQTYLRALTDDSGRWPATEEGIKQAYKHARQLEIEAFDASRKKDSFLPGTDLLDLGLPDEATVAQQRVKRRVSQTKETFPEAIPLKYQRNEEGEFIIGEDGKPKPSHVEYSFAETPVAKSAIKGIRNQEQREKVIVMALGDKLATFYNKVKSNPEIKAGEKWYSTARTRLKKLFGDDSKFFSELLGATSARTPVEINFRFALDAYNQFKQGEYDSIISKYREGKTKWDKADIADFVKSTGNKVPTRGQFLDWWITENDLTPTQSNGKKFGANSRSVLRVLDGSWASEVQGPKTPNFAGNLVGSTFEATIDVWAARALHRLSNEGSKDKWRILPEMETGVTDADFNLGQAAFRHAANKLGIKPDALQAVLWFGEKNHWEENGWTRGAGAEKSDFNILLAKTERTTQGTMKTRTPQLDFSLETSDIKPRKKDK